MHVQCQRVTQEGLANKGAPVSEVIKHPASEGVLNTLDLSKVHFTQQ